MKSRKIVSKILLIMSTLLLTMVILPFVVCAGVSDQLYLKARSLSWKEFDDYGAKLMGESGTIYGIGYKSLPDPARTSFSSDGELYYGVVDYDGHLQNMEPFKDKDRYFGYRLEGCISWPLFKPSAEKQSLLTVLGLGVDMWQRSVGINSDESGYDELWKNIYGRAGLGYYPTKNVYISGGVKVPFWTQNSFEGINTNPGGKIGTYLDATISFGHFSANVFYESMKFVKSHAETYLIYYVWQPATEVQSIGASIGYNF
jgi:hypothetical protein